MKHLHMYTTCADDSEQAQTNKNIGIILKTM